MHRKYFLLTSVLLLSACSESSTITPLPAEEVLQESARASQTVESAAYDGSISFSTKFEEVLIASFDVAIQGTFQSSAKQAHFTVNGGGKMADGDGESSLQGNVEVILAGQNEMYVHIHDVSVEPEDGLMRQEMIDKVKGSWWQLPPDPQAQDLPTSVTPDPRLLQAQTQVVVVTNDHGLTKLDGHDVYHYDVSIDPDKLIAYLKQSVPEGQDASEDEAQLRDMLSRTDVLGTMWIDAQSYLPRKVQWKIAKKPNQPGATYTLEVTMAFTDHNAVAPITPPAESQLFSPFMILGDSAAQMVPYGTMSDEPLPISDTGELTDEQQEELIRQLLEGQSTLPPAY